MCEACYYIEVIFKTETKLGPYHFQLEILTKTLQKKMVLYFNSLFYLTIQYVPTNDFSPFTVWVREKTKTLWDMHMKGPHYKKRPPRQPLLGKPFAKGVVLKVLIKKPKKPNSANRKCVLVRLSTGKDYVLGTYLFLFVLLTTLYGVMPTLFQ